MDLITTTLPFMSPAMLRVATIMAKDVLKPKEMPEMAEPRQPMIRIGLRPNRSLSCPQWKTVNSCATEKMDSI